MKLLLAVALAVVSLSAGCVPIPTKNTYQLFQAQGAGAKTSKNCSGGPSSAFHFPIGPHRANRLTVSLDRFEGRVQATLWAYAATATDIQFSPERLRLVSQGRQLVPASDDGPTLVQRAGSRNRTHVDSVDFNISIAPNEMVEVIVLPGAVRIDGQDKPLPAMRFAFVTLTEIKLSQPLNC